MIVEVPGRAWTIYFVNGARVDHLNPVVLMAYPALARMEEENRERRRLERVIRICPISEC